MAETTHDNPGVKLPPPFIYIAFMAVALLIDRTFPIGVLPATLAWALGLALMAAGVLLLSPAIGTFWRAGTSMVPARPATALVTGGPYRFTRNPMYLGLATLYLGLAVLLNTLWPILLLPLLLVTVTQVIIAREERYLERRFGEQYLRYKARVRRWL